MTRCDHLSEETDPHKTAKACKPPQQAEALCLSDAQAKMQAWLAEAEKLISSKTLPIIDSSSSCINYFKLQCRNLLLAHHTPARSSSHEHHGG